MEKRKISITAEVGRRERDWMPLQDIADVEVSSESSGHPIEAALLPGYDSGWIADAPGRQIVRLTFKHPPSLHHVRVVIEESERERTQEFVLRAASSAHEGWRELARQQFNFSPNGATRQEEDYRVELPSVSALEIIIVPDISGGDARASLQQLRLA